MNRITAFIILITFFCSKLFFAQDPMKEMGGESFHPSYESFRTDKFIEEDQANYSGDLSFSIPLLTVPGRHGHNFEIRLTYNSNIHQNQTASWVGLGWDLELGSVSRTVNGRTDEAAHLSGNLGTDQSGRGNLGGRFKSDYLVDPMTSRDILDQYNLSIDGGGMEIMPVSYSRNEYYTINPSGFPLFNTFLPVKYKPWKIQSSSTTGGPIDVFSVTKEDGTLYSFGGAGATEKTYLREHNASNPPQSYEFPNRWNLESIHYTDGSTTTITYQFQNPPNNPHFSRYNTIMIDRSDPEGDMTKNLFGTIPPSGILNDYVLNSYTHPTQISTDTHYLVFLTTSGTNLHDSTDRNCRLDQIILYEKGTNIELKRIVFDYASGNNLDESWWNPPTSGNANDWETTGRKKLNNDQLTLIGFSIQHGTGVFEDNSADLQKYVFKYTTNPKMNVEGNATVSYPNWPGYFTTASLATAWRLKSITLPTGGIYEYNYEQLGNINYDPEGRVAQSYAWNYSSEPRCRLTAKHFIDGFGQTKTWHYNYSSEVVFDPPSCINQSTYIPYMYVDSGVLYTPWEYYKYYRNCNVGHRWVKITQPDGTWQTSYFTSSYKLGSSIENKADYISSQPQPYYTTIAESRSAQRSIVWKVETGSGATVSSITTNYYTFLEQGRLFDRYDYYELVNQPAEYHYVIHTSYLAKLDSIVKTINGVKSVVAYLYKNTPRDLSPGNGLIGQEKIFGSNCTKTTDYAYAYEFYPEMDFNQNSKWMLSQIYSKVVRKPTFDFDVYKEFTSWQKINDHWLPVSEYVWNGSSTDNEAPTYYYDNNVLRVKTYNYDSYGYSDVLSVLDANNYLTYYYYSDNINDPFTNTTGGLSKGYVTGVKKPQSTPLLRLSYNYDHYGNVTSSTDENNDTTKIEYDALGRIASVYNPLNQLTSHFTYYLSDDLSVSDPNFIEAESFRTPNESTTLKSIFDGAGRERQKLIFNGSNDIIAATDYDNMDRVSKSYKTYEVNLGSNAHNYDVNYVNNSSNLYKWNEYYLDGLNRIKKVHGEGNTSNHYSLFEYGTNVNTYDYLDNRLFKTTQYDENNDYSNPSGYRIKKLDYHDIFGNLVKTVVDSADLALTTSFKYDLMGRILGSAPPSRVPSSFNDSEESTFIEPSTTGVITVNDPTVGGEKTAQVKITSLTNYADNKSGYIVLDLNGPTVYYSFKEYKDNVLINQSQQYSLHCAGDDSSISDVYTLSGDIDRVDLVVEDIYHPYEGSAVKVKLIYSSKNEGYTTKYTYNKRGLLTEKYSVDADTIKYLYDKAGNLRFSKDAKQKTVNKFTYSKYDGLNRITEVGEYTSTTGFTNTNAETVTFPLDSDPNKTIVKKVYFDNTYYTGQQNTLGKPSKTVAYKQGSVVQTTYFSYNDIGKVEWIVRQIPNLQEVKISYWYDFQGNITKKCVSDAVNGSVYTFYEYDAAGRLNKIFSNLADSEVGKVKEAEYTYNADGTIKRLQLANSQGMDYVYNNRGWLNQINHQNLTTSQDPGHDGPGGTGVAYIDKFSELMGYENQDHIATGTGFTFQPQYNGNISWAIMRTMGAGLNGVNAGISDPIIGYVYNYDNANRLTKADFGYYHTTSGWSNSLPKAAMYDLPSVSYDPDGNILTLQRKGIDALMMDNFSYTYQSGKNRLASITNAVNSQTYNYTYDNNGNVTSDQYRGISNITYNTNNLPEELLNSQYLTMQYTYDENNNRIRKLQTGNDDEYYILGANGETESVFDENGNAKFYNINNGGEIIGRMTPPVNNLTLSNTALSGTYEAQNLITVETNVTVSGTTTLKAGNTINLKPGFTASSGCNLTISVSAVTSDKYYYLKDHLGSIRVVVDTVGEIVSYDDYDAWGMQLAGRSANYGYANDKYKFTGKELDTETGYFHFGARAYDGRIGRWNVVDPLFEKYPNVSPYNYALNNPLRFIDPKGKEVKGYTERLKSSGGIGKFVAAIVGSRHAYIRIITPTKDLILELWGPEEGSDRGRPRDNQPGEDYLDGRLSPAEFKIYRPNGIGPNDFSFENKILEIFSIMKKILPKYDAFGTNSNGFIKFLVEEAGGALELPDYCYFADTEKYKNAYDEYINNNQAIDREDKSVKSSGSTSDLHQQSINWWNSYDPSVK